MEHRVGRGPAGNRACRVNYSRQYPKNPKSLNAFSYLTNTVMRRRGRHPYL